MTVVVFDNLSQGHRKAVHPEAVLVEGDLADTAAIDATFVNHSVDAVMHFASRTLVGRIDAAAVAVPWGKMSPMA